MPGPNTPILTPCIGICELDGSGFCEGCLRTGDEIARWISYSDAQRRELMERVLPLREQARDAR